MAFFSRFASRTASSMGAAALAGSCSSHLLGSANCEEAAPAPAPNPQAAAVAAKKEQPKPSPEEKKSPKKKPGFQEDAEGYFFNMIPNSQLFQPKKPWPFWDGDWDNREPTASGNDKLDRRRKRYLRKYGVTRHIILIRHGQYDETHKEDEKRILTEMGRQQAHETGKRLARMLEGLSSEEDEGGNNTSACNIKVVRVSNLTRAKETADIIASHIPQIERADPDPLLNEGRPAHTVPSGGRVGEHTIQKTAEGHKRIEEAFQKYFYRAEEIPLPDDQDFLEDGAEVQPPENDSVQTRHEYEIIVCHANVIRYFLCRALQLPPEAWLRLCTFNCSLTYLTIRPTGGVSCRMLGDVGHLPSELISFSGHIGFNW